MYFFCLFFSLQKKSSRIGWLIFVIANFVIVPRPWDFTGWDHYHQHYMGSILRLSFHFLAALKELKMSRPSTADRTISAKLCRQSLWSCRHNDTFAPLCGALFSDPTRQLAVRPAEEGDVTLPSWEVIQHKPQTTLHQPHKQHKQSELRWNLFHIPPPHPLLPQPRF